MLTYAKIPPAVNQIEINPSNTNSELVRFLHSKNIRPVAYSPIGRFGMDHSSDPDCPADWFDLSKNEVLLSLSKKYNKSVVQIMLNWGLSKGHVVIPKSTSLTH